MYIGKYMEQNQEFRNIYRILYTENNNYIIEISVLFAPD